MQVDEDGASEPPVFIRGVSRDVRVVYGELDDLRGSSVAYERVDDEAGVVGGLNVRRKGRIELGPIDRRVGEGDRLELGWEDGCTCVSMLTGYE